jgi:hypothetical protein
MGVDFLKISLTSPKQIKMQEIQTQIDDLESQLTGDMFKDMDIKDTIHNLKMKRDGVKPANQQIDCVGCGS